MKNICLQMNRKAWLAIAMLLGLAFPALAQKITVSGTVYEPDGLECIGASVSVQGLTNVGVVTDIDGRYTIEVAPDATLVFSFVGCDPQTVAVEGRTNIDVHFSTGAVALQEVVAVGYGTVKKKDATGSVAVIKPDDIEAGLATSANDLLVGASPGVVVTTDGGNPSAGAQIRIRGGASLNANNDPLVVIDGVPMSGSYGSANALTMVAPDNIESLTILKDASATAIYGSRASNGVIIITTKKGQSGRPQINFSANWHMNTASRRWDVLDGDAFRNMVKENCSEHAATLLGDANTDWQDQIYRTSFSQDYNLSVGGTVGFLPYRVSVSYTDNNGILKTSSMQRTTVGFNLTPRFFDGKLQISANVKGSYMRDKNADTGAVGAALTFNPTLPVMTDYTNIANNGVVPFGGYTSLINNDGNLETNGSYNPLAILECRDSQNKMLTSNGNLQIDYALHFLPELHLNLNLGYDVVKGETNEYIAQNSPQSWKSNYNNGAGQHYYNYQLSRNTLLDFYANYKKEFAAIKSNVDVMLGYSWQRNDWHRRYKTRINTRGYTSTYDAATNAWNMVEDPASDANIGYAYGDTDEQRNYVGVDGNQYNLVSFFGRLNYIFDDTYLLTFTLRDDGTSRFAKETRWGLFPAVALGWKINNMAFFEKFTDKWSEFKLRLGWGVTGQQDIGSYNTYVAKYSISQPSVYYPSATTGEWINPLFPNAYDANTKWEETTTWNVGIDAGWLNNRITASIEWYLRKTKDLLAYVPIPAGMTTTNAMTRNIGDLQNVGLELNIGAKPIVTNDFVWSTGFNVAWNKNEITALTGSAEEDESFTLDAMGNPASENAGAIGVHKVGYPAGSFRVLEQVYDADGYPVPNCYVDQNGDGTIDSNDLVIKHSRDPKVTMTWTNNFSWKHWDLGFTLRASIGNYVYNGMRARNTNIYNIEGQGNILNNILVSDYYFNDGTAVTNLVRSDYFLENAGFVRCDNITLGYTWENLLKEKLRLRLFAAVQNPFVITKYKGLDPEIASGVDNNAYPRPMTVSLGLVATF